MRYTFAIVVLGMSLTLSAVAGDWPAFRGPLGNGHSTETNVPVHWSRESNVQWRVPMPGEGNSSPIVSGDRVFVTCAQDEGKKLQLFCLNRADGSQRWVRTVEFDRVMPTHQTNPYAAATPATDGQRVVVWYGSAGLFCYDLDGKELWHRDLGEFRHQWGYAASPILYKNLVIQNCAPGKQAFMAAFNADTGADVWRVDEPANGDGNKRSDGAPMGTWSTPIIVPRDGVDQMVVFQPNRVVAYRPLDGEIIWHCGVKNEKGDLAYSSAIIANDVCIALGGYNGGGTAFRLGGTGDLTESSKLWYKPRNPQSIGTGIVLDGYLYVPDAGPSTIRCLEASTGKEMWATRDSGANHWGSIVLADGRLYVTNQDGATVVFKPNPDKFELIARNELGEHCNATPAISNGQIFIRTFENLYCVADKK